MKYEDLNELKHTDSHQRMYDELDSLCRDLQGVVSSLEMETRYKLREFDEAYKLPLNASKEGLEQAIVLVKAARVFFDSFMKDLREKVKTEHEDVVEPKKEVIAEVIELDGVSFHYLTGSLPFCIAMGDNSYQVKCRRCGQTVKHFTWHDKRFIGCCQHCGQRTATLAAHS